MGLIAKDSGGGEGFEPLPPGTYTARCVSVVDLGIQQTGFGGKEKIYLGFEVPSERVKWKDKDGNELEGPAFIGSRYTLSIHEKSILGQHLTSWRGKAFTQEERDGFDVFNVLGAPCLISVVHTEKNGKVYANIQSIMRMPKGMEAPAAESETIAYTPNDIDKIENLTKLPEWLQKLCREGYKIAEGSTIVGSALAANQAAGGQVAGGQPPPQPVPGSQEIYPTADAAMQAAMDQTADDFDDDIPF